MPRSVLLLPLVLLAACGGGADEGDAEDVVRQFAKAVNDSDGEKLCNDLVTSQYLEETTFAKGDAAIKQCKRQIDGLKRETFRLVKIEKTELDGDSATVTAQIETQGQRVPQSFRLEKQDGEFRLTSNQP